MDQLLKLFDLTLRDLAAIPVAMIWFYVLYKSLKTLVFDPFLKLESLRDAATTGAAHEAEILEEKAKKISIESEEKLKVAREKALSERNAVLDAAKNKTLEIESQARTEATNFEVIENKKLVEEKLGLEKSLVGETDTLSNLVTNRVVELSN